jgi:Fic family protein
MAASKNRKSAKKPAKSGKPSPKGKVVRPSPKKPKAAKGARLHRPAKGVSKRAAPKKQGKATPPKAVAKGKHPAPKPQKAGPNKPQPKAAARPKVPPPKPNAPKAGTASKKAQVQVATKAPPPKANHVAAQPKGAKGVGPGPAKAHPAPGHDAKRLNGAGVAKQSKRALTANEAALPPPPMRKGSKHPSAPPKPPPAMREAPRMAALPLPLLPPPKRQSIEERASQIEQRLASAGEEFRKRYLDSLDMSWIYHDSALEGVVYTFEELRTALGAQPPPIGDSSLQPTYDDIRRHKEAIDFVRDFGEKKRLPVTVDVIKKIFLILHPEEGDIKTVKYRKDIPQHRLYFHEYAPPDKVAYKVRQIVDWLNDPETRKTRNGIRIAARAHYDLLRVYPFANDSGKVSRLFMNLLLMRTGLPPSILHSTERQRYYEALKGSATTVLQMVQEAVENALSSVEKLLDEHETKKRAFVS